ncbi:allantoinase, mitochondrial-like [Sceloporus undulatus]|uniref:allantoinase, mitochondrial-like n=1 Tax=Sceloporus undulatus TaxID=8520 RepID=UPI001C4DA950|nr:allantoinase, mitochondrial-like [Sceloporus undulatus]
MCWEICLPLISLFESKPDQQPSIQQSGFLRCNDFCRSASESKKKLNQRVKVAVISRSFDPHHQPDMSRKSSTQQAGPAKLDVGSEVMYVRSNRVVLDNTIGPAEIVICNGKIAEVLPKRNWARPSAEKVFRSSLGKAKNTWHHIFFWHSEMIDVGDLVVMPGIIDPHVHICEPGHPSCEGFASVTKAAAAGGITTIVDMPGFCCPPATTLSALDSKFQSAKGQCHVDVAFWGAMVPGNQVKYPEMQLYPLSRVLCAVSRVCNERAELVTKTWGCPGGEDKGTKKDFHAEQDPNQSMPVLADTAEYSTFLDSRPDTMEVEATLTIAELCLLYKVPCHIINLSSAQALPIIKEARHKGAPITVETTHHYLSLSSECIPSGGTYYKCCPPIREKSNQEQLWAALKAGQIDMVVSAHVPCFRDFKDENNGDFLKAQAGIASLQFGLPLFWTSAKYRRFSFCDLVQLLCKNPAILSRLEDHKGSLSPGMDADLVIWDPEKEFEVKKDIIHHKCKLTPYLGFKLCGKVFATLVRGRLVYLNGKFAPKAQGELLVPERKVPTKIPSPYY